VGKVYDEPQGSLVRGHEGRLRHPVYHCRHHRHHEFDDQHSTVGDGCAAGQRQINCAVSGLKSMLQLMDPCPLNQTCPGNSVYVDRVSLFVFPAVEITTSRITVRTTPTCPTLESQDHALLVSQCEDKRHNLVMNSTPTSVNNLAGTYEVNAFDDGYRANDSSSTLDSGDGLASAVGYKTSGGCTGLQAPGGEGTYYAQVITQRKRRWQASSLRSLARRTS